MNQRLLPMLAVASPPFDSPEYLFEVKWNGVRALAARQVHAWDLWGRELADYRPRYPELQVLTTLPPGTVLDGELVQLLHGVPDLEAMLARHQLTQSAKIQRASHEQPVSYVVFDLMAYKGRSLLGQPLKERRSVLRELIARWQRPRLQFSEGVIGPGLLFFEQAVRQGQEGVMAKHLDSRYLPGRRSVSWRKIKPSRRLPCVIIGWQPGVAGVCSLLVAGPCHGCLRYLAQVRTGFTDAERRRLAGVLAAVPGRSRPLVPCPHPGRWLEPELVCQVNYLDRTSAGRLRGASFHCLWREPERS
jgi:ATP-dependent DNA ligase